MAFVNQFDTSSTRAALPSKPVRDPPATVDASISQLPAEITLTDRRLTAAEFQGLADIPPEFEWFENLKNPGTKRIYKNAIRDFMRFTGIIRPEGIVNLSRRGMLVVSVARQHGSGNSFARLLCCPAQAERGRKKALWVR